MEESIERTTPIGLARYACNFLDAADCVDDNIGINPGYEIISPIPVYYLTGHSIELFLKSFLLDNGIPLEELKFKLGHNLDDCLEQCKVYGLYDLVDINEEDESVLNVLNALYSNKEFEYFTAGYKEFPIYGPLQVLTSKLKPTICKHVGFERYNAD